jgi:hypothetical protein
MRANMIKVSKGLSAALLLAALAACGSGLNSSSGTAAPSSSTGGGSNNTPPGIPNNIVFIAPASGNTVIALQGTGGKTNAEVTFEVDDASNTGVPGVAVTFSLIPSTGDASLTTTTGTTAANGQASTFVVSCNEHYSVTVLATVSTPSGVKTASSNSLAITTGIPTQGNFAMASAKLTANNADDTQNVTDVITVQLSDRFNNPAPDGTAVAFTANIGQIPGACLTVGGGCSVTWSSSGDGIYNLEPHIAGHVEILAYTVGEESFTDVNGDGVFDDTDSFTTYPGTGAGDAFDEGLGNPGQDDIGEVYLDGNEIGSFQSGEFFHDFNNDHIRNPPDGKFYGFGCKGTATVHCGSTTTKEIGKQICIAASTSSALIGVTGGGTGATFSGNTLSMGTATTATVTFTVSDMNGQGLASGTAVSLLQAGITGAITISIPTNLPFTYQDSGCGSNQQTFTVTVALVNPPPAGVLPGGTLQLNVVTPGAGGALTPSNVITITQ